jgi:hypothetical protein
MNTMTANPIGITVRNHVVDVASGVGSAVVELDSWERSS